MLDACVLYPTVLREILMACAARGLFRPQWSARILEEWARATVKLGPRAEGIARAEVAALRAGWTGAEIAPRQGDLARLRLPDPNDVHVLAAAIAGSADLICTFNIRDFPRGTLAEEGLERCDPDQLLARLPAEEVAQAARAVHARAEDLSGEVMPIRDLMKRARLPKLGKRLAPGG